jgi:ferrous iron transport protein B
MGCHGSQATEVRDAQGVGRVVLVGNPNVGKSVLFGLLTGKYTTVSNYPGTTVEVSQGSATIEGGKFLLVDTPGVNSLLPMSEDEQVTRDILLRERPAKVVQVGDSKNLRRTLYLTLQLAEMGLPVVLDLNMEDEARDRGITIDVKKLRSLLGTEVVSTVASERRGLRGLRAAITSAETAAPVLPVRYHPLIEEYIERVAALLPRGGVSRRSLAAMIVSGDESLAPWLTGELEPARVQEVEALADECRRRFAGSVGLSVNEARMKLAGELAGQVISKAPGAKGSVAAFIGRMSMHPVWGIPLLLAVLYALYLFVGVLGAGTLVDFMENIVFGRYLNPMFAKVVDTLVPLQFFRDMLVGRYGIITMALTYAIAIILPITTTFFIAFSILEDSGYLPRLAVMSNRIFNVMGLSGKAVLPMVLGLGCGTMAVMTTRILETRRERVIATFLLALAVPCSAQLGVIMGIMGSLSGRALSIWILTVLGILLLSGFLASKLVRGSEPEFFLELPPIRMPTLANVMVKTGNRAIWYLKEAVPLFIYGTLALFLLDKLHMLGAIERFLSPVVTGVLGLPQSATEAFLIGFFRRDYGAAGLYALSSKGMLTPVQTLVSLVTLTLFVPCLAHLLMMIKERGMRLSLAIFFAIIPIAVAVGGVLNWVLRTFDINLL